MEKRFLLVAFVALLALINVVDGQNNDAKLKSLVRQMLDAQVGYDAVTLDKIYAADYVEISPVGEYDSREKAIGFYKPEATPNRDKIKRVVEAGEITIRDYGKFRRCHRPRNSFAHRRRQQPRSTVSFPTTFVCRKEKGDWKIASVHNTGMTPPITQPAK